MHAWFCGLKGDQLRENRYVGRARMVLCEPIS